MPIIAGSLGRRTRLPGARIYKDAQKRAEQSIRLQPEWYPSNKLFIEGDHWQGGAGWVGALPEFSSDREGAAAERLETITRIRRQFTSQNAMLEVVRRHVGGVLGRSPLVNVVTAAQGVPTEPGQDGPNPEDDGRRRSEDLVARWLRDWMREVGFRAVLQDMVGAALWGEVATVRFYLDPLHLERDEQNVYSVPESFTPEQAVETVRCEVLRRDVAAVERDPATGEQVGVALVGDGRDKEVVTIEGDDTVARIGERETLRVSINRRLTMVPFRLPLFVTPQMSEQQRQLNRAHTLAGSNLDWTGFTERTFLNTQPPKDQQGNDVAYRTGPNTTNFAVGVPSVDPETGRITYSTPSVQYRQPVTGAVFDESIVRARTAILSDAHQLHIIHRQAADVSGDAIVQARHDFLVSLTDTATELDRVGVRLLEVALLLLSYLCGEIAESAGSRRVLFEARLDPGPLTQTEVEKLVRMHERGVLSTQTFRQLAGLAEPEMEATNLLDDPSHQLAMLTKRAALVEQFVNAGLTHEAAFKLAGLAPELVGADDVPSDDLPTEQ